MFPVSFSASRDHDAAVERADRGEEGDDGVAALRGQGQPRARPQLEQGQRPDAQERGKAIWESFLPLDGVSYAVKMLYFAGLFVLELIQPPKTCKQ